MRILSRRVDEEIIRMDTEVYSSSSEEETFQLGVRFARRITPGDLVAFYGDLGAGKTEFIKGICEGMGVDEIVSSPTYTIVNQYRGESPKEHRPLVIFHVDLYRIEDSRELLEIGLSDILRDPSGVKLIEWSENAGQILSVPRWDICLSAVDDDNERRIRIIHHDAATIEKNTHVVGRG